MCCAVPKINQLRLYWANKTVNYSVLILLTLLGVVIPAWYYQLNTWITPLILGVIAAALADRDDRFSGRLKSIILTLICFAIAAFSIEILFQTRGCLRLVYSPQVLVLSCSALWGTLRQHRVCFSTGCRVHHARCPSKHEYLVSAVTFTQRQRLVLLDVDAVACLLANAARTTKPR